MSYYGRFRKRSIEIEAIQISARLGAEAWDSLPKWLWDAYERGDVLFRGSDGVDVRTLEGWTKGSVGDWILRGVEGELYPCKDSIFRATYDPVGAALGDLQGWQ